MSKYLRFVAAGGAGGACMGFGHTVYSLCKGEIWDGDKFVSIKNENIITGTVRVSTVLISTTFMGLFLGACFTAFAPITFPISMYFVAVKANSRLYNSKQ
jgi:hypothetical protein